MKQLYTILSLLLVGLVSFAADAFTITFNVDNPEYAAVFISYEQMPLVAGDNPFEFSSDWTTIEIESKNGGKIASVKDADGNDIDYKYGFSSSQEKYGGKTIFIKTQSPEEFRTESVKVNIDKASSVKIGVQQSESTVSYYPELTDGENTIWYEPGVDKMLRIYSSVSTSVPLYSVTVVNGTTVPVQKNYVYNIPLPCDGEVDVKAVFPDLPCTITFEYETEDIKGFITKVTKDTPDGETVDFSAGSFDVNAGSILYLYGNKDDYLLASFKVDGLDTDFRESPYRLVVIDQDITLSFAGRMYNRYNVSVSIDDPDAVIARYGLRSDPGDVIALVKGDNTVPVSENNPNIYFQPSEERTYKIASASYNGLPIEGDYLGYYSFADLRPDDMIEVTTAEYVRDLEAVVYIDKAEEFQWILTDAFAQTIELKTGYNHINFCTEDSPFKLKADGYGVSTPYVYVNDDPVEAAGWSFNKSFTINLAAGSVAKIFATASEEPQWFTLTFEENGFDAVDVLADEIRPITDRVGFETLAGTKIELTPKEGKEVDAVTVDGEPVIAAEGKFVFTVSGNHNIAVTTATGIEDIEAANKDGQIYNLQGIRVTGTADQLPAGIYIVNGKKVLVK